MQILLPDIEKFNLIKGLNKGVEINEVSKFWSVRKDYPKEG